MNFCASAINLKTYPINEADNIVVMYSKEKGLMKGVAKGAKRQKSKLGAHCDVLCANKFMLYKGKGLDTICEAESLNTFNGARKDLDKLLYSLYLTELVRNFGAEEDSNSKETYELLYSALSKIALCEGRKDILIQVIKFQLKYMNILGLGLELNVCLKCMSPLNENEVYFSAQNGGVYCKNCSEGLNITQIHYKLREFLYTLSNEDFNTQTRYDALATEKICEFCHKLIKQYINTQSSKFIKNDSLIDKILN